MKNNTNKEVLRSYQLGGRQDGFLTGLMTGMIAASAALMSGAYLILM